MILRAIRPASFGLHPSIRPTAYSGRTGCFLRYGLRPTQDERGVSFDTACGLLRTNGVLPSIRPAAYSGRTGWAGAFTIHFPAVRAIPPTSSCYSSYPFVLLLLPVRVTPPTRSCYSPSARSCYSPYPFVLSSAQRVSKQRTCSMRRPLILMAVTFHKIPISQRQAVLQAHLGLPAQ